MNSTTKLYLYLQRYEVIPYDLLQRLTNHPKVNNRGEFREALLELAVLVETVSFDLDNLIIDMYGSVDAPDGVTITERGFCIADHATPTKADYWVPVGDGTGEFDIQNVNINYGEEYTARYIRAYAITDGSDGLEQGDLVFYGDAISILE